MLSIFNQISELISSILISVSSNYWLFVFLVFLVCVGEAVFVLGLLVPSLPILLLVGGLISAQNLDFWPIYLAATFGGVVGDAISYWIGFLLKDRIKTIWPFRNYLDRDGGTAKRVLGIRAYPDTFIISPAGVLLRKITGERDWSDPRVAAALEAAFGGDASALRGM